MGLSLRWDGHLGQALVACVHLVGESSMKDAAGWLLSPSPCRTGFRQKDGLGGLLSSLRPQTLW